MGLGVFTFVVGGGVVAGLGCRAVGIGEIGLQGLVFRILPSRFEFRASGLQCQDLKAQGFRVLELRAGFWPLAVARLRRLQATSHNVASWPTL